MKAEEKFWRSRKEGHVWVLVRRRCASIQYQLESWFLQVFGVYIMVQQD